MSIATYVPDNTKIVHNTSVDFVTRYINKPVHLVQFDNSLPIVAVALYNNNSVYTLPDTDVQINVRIKKPDGNIIYNPVLGVNAELNTVYIEVTTQMVAVWGEEYPVIEIRKVITEDDVRTVCSGTIHFVIDKNPVNSDDIASSSEGKAVEEFVKLAKSWAIGETGLRPGEESNNSKYFSEQSARSSAEASVSEVNAYNSSIESNDWAINASSWAIGGTGTRPGEDTDNAKYYSEVANEHLIISESWAIGGTGERPGEDTNNSMYFSGVSNDWAINAESWAIGGTGTRPGEDTDNSKYYSEVSEDNSIVSESWAIGGTGVRLGEDTDNSMYYSQVSNDWSITAESWAIGGTGTRPGEDTDNAKYYCDYSIDYATESKSWAVGGTGTRTDEDSDNSKFYKEWVENAFNMKLPVLSMNFATGEVMYEGGVLTLEIDNDGMLAWYM